MYSQTHPVIVQVFTLSRVKKKKYCKYMTLNTALKQGSIPGVLEENNNNSSDTVTVDTV